MKKYKSGNIVFTLLILALIVGVGYFIYNSVKNPDVDLDAKSKAAAANASSSYGYGSSSSRSSSSSSNSSSSSISGNSSSSSVSGFPKPIVKLVVLYPTVKEDRGITYLSWECSMPKDRPELSIETCTGGNFQTNNKNSGLFSLGVLTPTSPTEYRLTAVSKVGTTDYVNVSVKLPTTRPNSNSSVSTSATKSMWNFWPVNLFVK